MQSRTCEDEHILIQLHQIVVGPASVTKRPCSETEALGTRTLTNGRPGSDAERGCSMFCNQQDLLKGVDRVYLRNRIILNDTMSLHEVQTQYHGQIGDLLTGSKVDLPFVLHRLSKSCGHLH